MEEIFLDMGVMTTTNLKTMMKTKGMDLMVIPMPKCTAGAIYARRDAYQHRSVSGVVAVGKESCIPIV
eukprot:3297048-Amphidinium_carterae.1